MHPQPLFYLFGNADLPVYAYGICMASGIVLCFLFLMYTMGKMKFNEEASDKILIIGVCGTGLGIFSAMLFQAIYDYIDHPSQGFNISGSMTFIGGLIGGVLGFLIIYWLYIYVVAPRTKIKILQNNMNATLTDALPFIPIGIVIAHAFGRFGCFWAGCCYGKTTTSWIGIACAAGSTEKVIPTQLFEMAFLIILGVVMAVLYFKFKFNYNFGLYSFAYGVWRFLIEFLRGDYRGTLFGDTLSPSQIWSLVMIAMGIGYIFLQKYVFEKHMKHPELASPVESNGEGALAAE